MLQTPGSGVQGRSASDMAVASITAALKHRLQLDGSPAPGSATSETRSAARLDDRDTEDLTTLQQLLQACNQSVSTLLTSLIRCLQGSFTCCCVRCSQSAATSDENAQAA